MSVYTAKRRQRAANRGRPRVLKDPVRVTTNIDYDDYAVLLQFIQQHGARTIAEAVRIAVRRGVGGGSILA